MPLDLPKVELVAIAPEVALVITALITLLVDAIAGERDNRPYLPLLATIGLGVAGYLAVGAWMFQSGSHPELQLANMVVADGFAAFVKVTLSVFGVLAVWLSRDYLKKEHLEDGEYYGLALFAVAGMMVMASAADLLVVFLALETFSIALYVLVGFHRRSAQSQEAAMKYFLLGAFSSAFFLLGIAFVYGAVGTTNLYGTSGAGGPPVEGILTAVRATPSGDFGLLLLATGFLVIGLGFKIAAVPFHMWTPDAYQGAPSPVTGFMAAGSKLAGFAALLRILDVSLFSLRWDWRPLVVAIAVLTMFAGSILAVVQEDLKRLLAYSSIAHAGFVLTGVIAASDNGISGSLFYLATYGLTVLGAFAIVAVLAGSDELRVRITDYRGLFGQRPLLAAALTLFLLSLAGVPLTSGFVGKLVVFGAVVEAGYAWVAVAGVVASAIAAFFYLKVMVAMYMQEPDEDRPIPSPGILATVVIGVTALATIALGLYWGPLIDLAERATFFAGG